MRGSRWGREQSIAYCLPKRYSGNSNNKQNSFSTEGVFCYTGNSTLKGGGNETQNDVLRYL